MCRENRSVSAVYREKYGKNHEKYMKRIEQKKKILVNFFLKKTKIGIKAYFILQQ